MSYCSINDAWGYTEKPKEPVKETFTQHEYIQNNDYAHPSTRRPKRRPKTIEKFSQQFLDSESSEIGAYLDPCQDFMGHLRECSKCRRKIKIMFRKTKVSVSEPGAKQIPDCYFYMLIGMFVILVLDALIRLSRTFKR